MTTANRSEITQILQSISKGDRGAVHRLMPLVYDELRSVAGSLMRSERRDHTFQPTELVNEAFLRLADTAQVDWKGRSHFFAIGARLMRRILVDHARAKLRKKRGWRPRRVELRETLVVSTNRLEDVLALDEALEKLARFDDRQARIVELRFFAGLTVKEVAEVLGAG